MGVVVCNYQRTMQIQVYFGLKNSKVYININPYLV